MSGPDVKADSGKLFFLNIMFIMLKKDCHLSVYLIK